MIMSHFINIFFSVALFVNAALFIPQAVKIYTTKTAKGISLFTFIGFLVIQFSTVLHALEIKDYILLFGYLLSMMTCGTVVVLVLFYKFKREPSNMIKVKGTAKK